MKAITISVLAGIAACAMVGPLPAAHAANFKEKVLWSFGNGADGQSPWAQLLDVKGIFYSTTEFGGTNGEGTVFSLNPNTGQENILYSFRNESRCEPRCVDGQKPWEGLIDVKGTLYGTTGWGGDGQFGGDGTVFALDPNTNTERVVYSFCNQQNCTDGSIPDAAPLSIKGVLYGTTEEGGFGSTSIGTVYTLDPTTGTEKVLYSFCSQKNCADGLGPGTGLIKVKGKLYGTTYAGGEGTGCEGGNYGCGTVFSLNPVSGAETVLHSFGSGTDGRLPSGSLISLNGRLYGTTSGGGAGDGNSCDIAYSGCGTVFSLNPNTGIETVLHSFCTQKNCTDGANPLRNLIEVNGILYGTTPVGGANSGGTVFSINPKTKAEKVLYSFCTLQNCADGWSPSAGLIEVKGTLYGTTVGGGTYGYGTVFALQPRK